MQGNVKTDPVFESWRRMVKLSTPKEEEWQVQINELPVILLALSDKESSWIHQTVNSTHKKEQKQTGHGDENIQSGHNSRKQEGKKKVQWEKSVVALRETHREGRRNCSKKMLKEQYRR